MVALHDFAAVIQRHSLFVLLALVATSSRSISSQSISTAVESRETKTSVWWPIVECVFLEDVNKCLQDRSVRAFIGLGRKDDIHIDTEKETVKMPGEQEEGIFDMLGDLVSDGIKTIFQNDDKKDEDDEDDDVEEGKEEAYEDQQAESGDNNNKVERADIRSVGVDGNEQRSLETGRGKKKKKKKKKKQLKKAIIKLIILLILIKLKIAKFLYVFGKFLQFKLVLMITINTILNVIRFLKELKRKKEDVIYSYEQAHHQHHYDENHHFDPAVEDDDKGWISGLWSRSGSYDGSGGVRSIAYAHDRAYSAQKPSQNSAYSVQEHSQDVADSALRPGQGPTRFAQTSSQDSTGYRQTSTQHSGSYWKKSTENESNYDKKSAPNVGVYSYVQNSNSNDQRSS